MTSSLARRVLLLVVNSTVQLAEAEAAGCSALGKRKQERRYKIRNSEKRREIYYFSL